MKNNIVDFLSMKKKKEKKAEVKSCSNYDYENDYDDDYDDFEDWEAEAEYYYSQNWQQLIVERTYQAKKYPNDPDCLCSLGEAYNLNSEFEKAIEYTYLLHKRFPDHPGIQHVLLKALFEMGKDETAIEWIVKPEIEYLGTDVLDNCYEFLRGKRKPRGIHDLYFINYSWSYMKYDEQELFEALKKDNRFVVKTDSEDWYNAEVSIAKRKK